MDDEMQVVGVGKEKATFTTINIYLEHLPNDTQTLYVAAGFAVFPCVPYVYVTTKDQYLCMIDGEFWHSSICNVLCVYTVYLSLIGYEQTVRNEKTYDLASRELSTHYKL